MSAPVVSQGVWGPLPEGHPRKCSEALHILDWYHVVGKMNQALDEVRAGESRRMASEGLSPC